MPPSGFSQKAINGLLTYVQESYRHTLENKQANQTEHETLTKTANNLEHIANQSNIIHTQQAATGLATFMAECYRDLAKEIEAGKDKYNRPVHEGQAIKKELHQIEQYLQEFTI